MQSRNKNNQSKEYSSCRKCVNTVRIRGKAHLKINCLPLQLKPWNSLARVNVENAMVEAIAAPPFLSPDKSGDDCNCDHCTLGYHFHHKIPCHKTFFRISWLSLKDLHLPVPCRWQEPARIRKKIDKQQLDRAKGTGSAIKGCIQYSENSAVFPRKQVQHCIFNISVYITSVLQPP